MSSGLPKVSVAQTLAEKIVALKPGALPAITRRKCEDLLIDVVGLCVTARNEDYVASSKKGCDDDGPCTAIGHQRTLTLPAPHSSTAPRRMARISTTPLKAGRSMPAR
jgi:hypothetical protein